MRRTGRFGVSVLDAAHAGGIRERARPGADRGDERPPLVFFGGGFSTIQR